MSDILNFQTIQERTGIETFLFDKIDSTNSEAARQIRNENRIRGLVIANEQTNGRGRTGHSFYSPSDTGIYMSYYFTPSEGLEGIETITARTAVAVLDALQKLYPETYKIKWVNDIYLNEYKVCGILTEAITTGVNRGSVIIGIGINVRTTDYPDDIRHTACSLPTSSATRNDLITQICLNLANICSNPYDNTYIEKYRKHSMLTGKFISYMENNTVRQAYVTGIDDRAGLLIKTSDGEQKVLRNGEVSLIRINPLKQA